MGLFGPHLQANDLLAHIGTPVVCIKGMNPKGPVNTFATEETLGGGECVCAAPNCNARLERLRLWKSCLPANEALLPKFVQNHVHMTMCVDESYRCVVFTCHKQCIISVVRSIYRTLIVTVDCCLSENIVTAGVAFTPQVKEKKCE